MSSLREHRSIYTFATICKENKELILRDKRLTYFVNIYGDRACMSEEIVNLLDYFKTGKPTDTYTGEIQDQVEMLREDDEWRENYMTIEMKMDEKYEQGKLDGISIGEKHGRTVGKEEALTELIRNLMETQNISESEAKKMLKIR